MAEQTMDQIGTETTIRTQSDIYNAGTLQKQLIHEVVSSAMNYDTIVKAFASGRAMDIEDAEKVNKTPCIIVGSGPSLDYVLPYLKDWKGGIFCTTSHALTLIRWGIEPTHIVALDPFCTYEEISGIDWSRTKTKLICHPGCWPTLIQKWPNEMLLYIQNSGKSDSFYSNVQKKMYAKREDQGKGLRDPIFRYYIRTEFAIFACSPPLQLFAADKLGYGTAFLCGCDFGFPGGKERFTSWTVKDKTEEVSTNKGFLNLAYQEYPDENPMAPDAKFDPTKWVEHVYPYVPGSHKEEVVSSNGIPSEKIHLYYKKNMLSAWRLCNKTMYTTDKGTITEVPYTDIRKLIKKQGHGYLIQTKEWIARTTDRYLATVHCFIVQSDNGVSFVESENPMIDLPKFMQEFNNQYYCTACKQSFKSNNGTDYMGKECPICKKMGVSRMVNIDIEKNMERFERLIKLAAKK